jgi:enoyl-CoA hydratase/carnithine racemase
LIQKRKEDHRMKEIADKTMDRPGCVDCSAEGAVGWLRLNNPSRLNAVSLTMWRQLDEAVERLAADSTVRVIVLSGTGGKAFCAGGDISEFASLRSGPEAMETYDRVGKAALSRLKSVVKPTIAMIEGYCLGGGVALALNCDLRVAADTARLGIPAAERAQSYDYPNIKALVDLVGPSQTKNILYTARQFRAEEAQRIGLVDELVPADKLHDHVQAMADRIAANAPLSIAATKFIVDTATADPDRRNLAACNAAMARCLASEDYAEANKAFMEKRRPVFTGR